MRVDKKLMFHVSHQSNWSVGDVIIAGKKENQFWNICKDYFKEVEVNGENMSLFKMFDEFPEFDVTKNNMDFLYENLKDVSNETAFYIREQVFEDIRKVHYPMLPSRQKCLWVCEEEQLPYWKTMHENQSFKVLTLELNGDLFCGDDYWLTTDTFSSIEYARRAKHYWSGEMSAAPRKEYLFYGKAIVKEII